LGGWHARSGKIDLAWHINVFRGRFSAVSAGNTGNAGATTASRRLFPDRSLNRRIKALLPVGTVAFLLIIE